MSPRPIKRLLVANRGEIATRIISSARELGIETIAVYTDNDVTHTYNAAVAVRLKSPASYMDVNELVETAKKNGVNAVHPGYGFLSESSQLANRMAQAGIIVVGPGAEILDRTGDKLQARKLAEECGVPVLPALIDPTGDVTAVRQFAERNGLPIMVKAVDGGGGRGIRLVRDMEDLQSLVTRAIEESPSKQVFAERAAIDGFRHVEVQIIGDGSGNVMHLWERECSIQRRYQKIVELAPSTIASREVVAPVIESALAMAKKINYRSLGTFEFLLNPHTSENFFLEVNPRLQVEHTISESICSVDIVKAQLRLAQGASFSEAGLTDLSQDPLHPPKAHSIQLRLTAEDPEKGYSLSIGKIQSFRLPSGNGVRVDTALVADAPAVVSSDFDSVIAKLIITARTWNEVVSKTRRALDDTSIQGITTNLALLRAIVSHPDFEAGACDTQWLEAKHEELLKQSRALSSGSRDPLHGLAQAQSASQSGANIAPGSSFMFRRDDAWQISLKNSDPSQAQQHHMQITKVLKNDFPSSFAADVKYTVQGSEAKSFTLDLQSTSASGSTLNSQHPLGDRSNKDHVVLPISGKLVEVLVDVGDQVKKDEAICVIKQMKMEIEIRSHKAGTVSWITEAEDDEDVAEGILVAVVEDGARARL
ncbi:uncharacterized protein LTR77_006125 [Saxophila tyrrhenica]|uniref:Uncharacterized protein n=1 Tax=Saxophila tyrrhenica TaxID=1690608 RepID=A0AAV9P959_9PEZI|nr:hypothetical protein LTR77_006125 [Saxophila tyrrhenica]